MRILFEDNHVLVAVKPPMVPTQADASGDADMLGMVREYLREICADEELTTSILKIGDGAAVSVKR